MNSHAQGPTVLTLNDRLRIFFSSRPTPTVSLPTFVDVELHNPRNIIFINERPILDLGEPGSFDEHGIIPKEVISISQRTYLYYIGWSRRLSTPYSLSIGVAVSDDGMNFTRCFRGPVLGVEKEDALSATAPGIIHEDQQFHMFYTAGLRWFELNGRYEHTYTIRHATSRDGMKWERNYLNVIEPRDDLECLSNPTILKIDGRFHMWYSFKGSRDFRGGTDSYRIGYASSDDLTNWARNDSLAGIDVSQTGWDSAMVEYPHARIINDKPTLFYNGAGFGATGFGYAELQKEL